MILLLSHSRETVENNGVSDVREPKRSRWEPVNHLIGQRASALGRKSMNEESLISAHLVKRLTPCRIDVARHFLQCRRALPKIASFRQRTNVIWAVHHG